VLGEFLAGVIIGVLIGLTLAPVLRSWIAWQVATGWRARGVASDDVKSTTARSER
jgi:hypothetical protein